MKWRKPAPPPAPAADEAADDGGSIDKQNEKNVDKTKKTDDDEPAKAPLGNYWRILSYGSRPEHGLMLGAFVASSASGVAMPLMQIVFGNLTGEFNSFGTDSGQDQGDFNRTINRYS